MKRFPQIDSIIKTPKGEGKVEKIDIFKNLIYLKYENEEWDKITLEESEKLMKETKKEPEKKADEGVVVDDKQQPEE